MSDDAPNERDYQFVLRPERSPFWRTEGLKIDMGADRWARVLGSRMLKHVKQSIQLGLVASGGPQKPLKAGTSRAKKAAQGKRPRARAFTEHAIFVRSLRLNKLSATKTLARYQITTDMPEVFTEWLVDEAARGVNYFPVTGDMQRLVEKTLDDLLRRAPRKGGRK